MRLPVADAPNMRSCFGVANAQLKCICMYEVFALTALCQLNLSGDHIHVLSFRNHQSYVVEIKEFHRCPAYHILGLSWFKVFISICLLCMCVLHTCVCECVCAYGALMSRCQAVSERLPHAVRPSIV